MKLHAGAQQMLTEIRGFEQVLITAAVEDDVPDALRDHRIRIVGGAVVEERAVEDA